MCGWQLFGVGWDQGKWRVRFKIPGEKVFCERFDDEVAAGKKYDAVVSAAKRLGVTPLDKRSRHPNFDFR